MDLWIRSQSKKQLANITGLIVVDNEIRGFTNQKDYYELGKYNKKERALEVLDDIEGAILKGAFNKKINGLGEVIDFIPNNLFVYEMPNE